MHSPPTELKRILPFRRQRPESPRFWLVLLGGSVLLHLLFWVSFSFLAQRDQSKQSAAIVSIDLIQLTDPERSAESLPPSDAATTEPAAEPPNPPAAAPESSSSAVEPPLTANPPDIDDDAIALPNPVTPTPPTVAPTPPPALPEAVTEPPITPEPTLTPTPPPTVEDSPPSTAPPVEPPATPSPEPTPEPPLEPAIAPTEQPLAEPPLSTPLPTNPQPQPPIASTQPLGQPSPSVINPEDIGSQPSNENAGETGDSELDLPEVAVGQEATPAVVRAEIRNLNLPQEGDIHDIPPEIIATSQQFESDPTTSQCPPITPEISGSFGLPISVRLAIDETGSVFAAEPYEPTAAGDYIEFVTCLMLQNEWQFSPAQDNNVPVAGNLVVEVTVFPDESFSVQ